MLQESSLVSSEFSMMFVMLFIELKLVLDVISNDTEEKDACNLDAKVSIGSSCICSEQSDGSGDHVATEEGSGLGHELVGVLVAVMGANNGSDELNGVLGIRGSEVAEEDIPSDRANVGTDTQSKDSRVGLFKSIAAESYKSENSNAGNCQTSGDLTSLTNKNKWKASTKQTRQQRYEDLYKPSTEESIGKTEAEIDEGSNLDGK